MSKDNTIQVNKKSRNVHFIRNIKDNIPLLIISDIHFDSLGCDHISLKKHLDIIKEKNGQIIIVGDLFDVMGCYKDPRTKGKDINPNYIDREDSYLDLVIQDTYEFLKPYKENILLIGYGNHETNILKRRDTDPIKRVVRRLNQKGGKDVAVGAYGGWIRFFIERKEGGNTRDFTLGYHHGSGGGAYRSKGILKSQMDAMEFPDVDLYVSGHDHNKIYDPSNQQWLLSKTGKIYNKTLHWLKTGTYQKPVTDMGWAVEKKFISKPVGGWFCDLKRIRYTINNQEYEYLRPIIYPALPFRQYI